MTRVRIRLVRRGWRFFGWLAFSVALGVWCIVLGVYTLQRRIESAMPWWVTVLVGVLVLSGAAVDLWRARARGGL